jgi:hypothetical protein
VTTVVAQFRFDDETAQSVEEPFRTLYRTKPIPHNRGIVYASGDHLRAEELKERRAMLRRRCERWMREHIPGVYAGFGSESTPACELLTFERADPLGGRSPPSVTRGVVTPVGEDQEGFEPLKARGDGQEDYFSVLGQRDDLDAWACAEMPGLVLRLPRVDDVGHRDPHLILSARVDTFAPDSLLGPDMPSAKHVTETTFYLSHTLGLFALARLVGDYEARISKVRDRLGEVSLNSRRAVVQMEKLGTELANVARDARPLLNGILAAPPSVWQSEIYTFLPVESERKSDGPLFASVATHLVERARRLLATERETRHTAESVSGLVAASANLRVARTAVRLQVFNTILVIAAIIVSALALPSVLKWLKALLIAHGIGK